MSVAYRSAIMRSDAAAYLSGNDPPPLGRNDAASQPGRSGKLSMLRNSLIFS